MYNHFYTEYFDICMYFSLKIYLHYYYVSYSQHFVVPFEEWHSAKSQEILWFFKRKLWGSLANKEQLTGDIF